ncbi:hypothetical protein ACUNI2_11130 [Serratia sp. IR-2025]|uniref:hypothetical protein n=1 Tax=Serratia marcescens TaxID=615 RepID=UPI001F14A274|nr:hypothetical protein [Serratia marcescens]
MTTESWTILSAVGACASALATFIAAIVALFAMHTWKSQERTKAYQRYLMALTTFEAELNILPTDFTSRHAYGTYSPRNHYRPDAIRAFSKCQEAWVGYSIYPHSESQLKSWDKLESAAKSYLYYGVDNKDIFSHISAAKKEKALSFWRKIEQDLNLPFD